MSEAKAAIRNSARRQSLWARLASPQGVMLGTLCIMYMITYIDRVNLATAAPFVQKELGLSPVELGLAFSAFAIPYGFLQPLGGWLGDRFGPRWVLFSAGLLWAAATVMTGLSIGVVTLFAARLLLGLGEGATFPTATKAMAIWLPPHRRAFAQGVTHSFARLGNAIAPPLVGYMIVGYGWRMPFYALGAVSFVWVMWWAFSFRNNPHAHPGMLPSELAELPPAAAAVGKAIPWAQLIRRILPVTLVDFCYGWTLWVYLTWLPSFLANEWRLPLAKFVWFSAAILFAGVIGDTVGGVLSDSILKRTGNLKAARRFNLVVGLLGSLLLLLPCLFVHDLIIVSICLSLAFFFLELTNAVLWALPMDIAPSYAGIAGGLMNTGFGVAGVLSPVAFGALLQMTGSWQAPFATSVVLLLAGVVLSLRIDPTVEVEVQ